MATAFENITRRLDRNPATRDTTYDKTKSFARAIKKVNTKILVPAFYLAHQDVTLYPNLLMFPGRIVMQYNYTMPDSFRISNYKDILAKTKSDYQTLLAYASLVIRWRVGTVTTRYRLNDFIARYNWYDPYVVSNNPGFAANVYTENDIRAFPVGGEPLYEGEVIPANFCIEIWSDRFFWTLITKTDTADDPPQGLLQDIELITNYLTLPTSVDDLGTTNTLLQSLSEFDVDNSIPENLDVDQPAGVQWLTN